MDISAVDTSAVRGDSFLHRTAAPVKLTALGLVLVAVIVTWNALVALAMALALAALVPACRLPAQRVFTLAAYPAVFAAVFAFASAPDWLTATVIVLKATVAGLAAVLLVFTTPYQQVFASVQRVMPPLVGDALLMTYRSLFIMLERFADLTRAVRLRSGARGRLPRAGATVRALGVLLLYALDLAQHDYDVLRARGYEGRMRVAPPARALGARDLGLVVAAAALLGASVTWRYAAGTLNPYSWMLPAAAALALALAAAARTGRRTA